MKPINKDIGFFCLIIPAIFHNLTGNFEIGTAFFIAALFYEAIKQ